MMDIKTIEIRHGEHEAAIPYYELIGKKSGPHIFLSAGMHGGEINGIALIEAFTEWSQRVNMVERLNGRLTILPLLNPSGFAHMQRHVYEDNGDLNRAFGVTEPTTFSEQIAHDLTKKILRHCDMGLDFHDASGTAALLPHARIHKDEASGCTREMGQLFGTDLLIERTGKPHMMAIHLHQQYHIPVLTVEIGGAQRLFPEYIETGLRGIRNVLAAKGMYAGDVILPDRQFLLTKRYGVKRREAAKIILTVKLGDFVHYGDLLGSLYDPVTLEQLEIRSPKCGIIFSLQQLSQVAANDTMFSILESDVCHIERTTLGNFKELAKIKVTKIKM